MTGWVSELEDVEDGSRPFRFEVFDAEDGERGLRAIAVTQTEYDAQQQALSAAQDLRDAVSDEMSELAFHGWARTIVEAFNALNALADERGILPGAPREHPFNTTPTDEAKGQHLQTALSLLQQAPAAAQSEMAWEDWWTDVVDLLGTTLKQQRPEKNTPTTAPKYDPPLDHDYYMTRPLEGTTSHETDAIPGSLEHFLTEVVPDWRYSNGFVGMLLRERHIASLRTALTRSEVRYRLWRKAEDEKWLGLARGEGEGQ